MKKVLIIVLTLAFFSSSTAQKKYFIFFKDKGITESQTLNKSSELYYDAKKKLSLKAIERRKSVMGGSYITFEDIPINKAYIAEIENLGIIIEKKLKWFNAVSAYLSNEQIIQISNLAFVNKIELVRNLESIQPIDLNADVNKFSQNLSKKNYDLDYGRSLKQNELSDIPIVHDLGINGEGVIIGLLDSGFKRASHPALENINVISEWDFVNSDGNTANENEIENLIGQDKHGTSVLSIIAGFDSGNLIGPAYGSSFLLAKTEDITSEKNIEEDNYLAALEWMEELGVDIISSSLGYSEFDPGQRSYTYEDMDGKTTIVAQAANLAFTRGIVTLTSAGNEGNKKWKYITSPGDAFEIITVGAVTDQNSVASFSSRGPTYDNRIKPEIVAMGSGVFNAGFDNKTGPTYNIGSGTSYSAPIAAGVAALLKSAHKHLTNKQIRKILIESADNSNNPDNDRGFGLISAKKAISFPNLFVDGIRTELHKIFINENGVDHNNISLYYRIDNGSFEETSVEYDGMNNYKFVFPELNTGQHIEFYFLYKTQFDEQVIEPINLYYSFSYGSNQIDYSTEINNLPNSIILYQNYPNPVNPSTKIGFVIPSDLSKGASNYNVILEIFDLLGRKAATLVNEKMKPGFYEVDFNASNFSSGVYFYRLQSGSFSQTKKLVILKK